MQILFNSPTFGSTLVLVLVQDLLLQSFLKVTTLLEDIMFDIFIKKEKIYLFLTDLISLSHFMQFSFVTF